MHKNTNSFEFTSQIGMCGGGGLSFCKQAYSILIDEDGEEYWAFDSSENKPCGYVWSLWAHYSGKRAMAIIGDGREQELKDLALRALSAAVSGDWLQAKSLVRSWDNHLEEDWLSDLD